MNSFILLSVYLSVVIHAYEFYEFIEYIHSFNTWIQFFREFIYVYEFYEFVWYMNYSNNWIHLVDCWWHYMNSYHDLLFWLIKFMYYMKLYNIWNDILDNFINQDFLQSFHFYVVTSLHSIKLNCLTQPQILKSRHVYIEVFMFLILIMVEMTNKQLWMVIMDKMDPLNLFVLGMEKLEDEKMINPHCFVGTMSYQLSYHTCDSLVSNS
jgi:hypothetical protein